MKGLAIPPLSLIRKEKTNRNLLDNPWFTINQRGATTWTSGYGVDRWQIYHATATINNGINVVGTDANGGIFQPWEINPYLNNKTITVSAIIDDVLYSATGVFPPQALAEHDTEVELMFSNGVVVNLMEHYYPSISHAWQQIHIQTGTDSHTIKALKLELGTVSTLANDVAPNYAEELMKCQRYFQAISPTVNFANSTQNSKYWAPFNFSIMRQVPSANYILVQGAYVNIFYEKYITDLSTLQLEIDSDHSACVLISDSAAMGKAAYIHRIHLSADL